MPINAGFEFQKLEHELAEAETISDKIRILKKMLEVGPKHKSAENLRNDIKKRIAKYKKLLEKEKQHAKGKGKNIAVKKEGAAQVVLIGKTNSGKSLLLSKITNAKPEIAEYEFTTKMPEFGIMDYNGIEVQVVEIPAVTEDFLEKDNGPAFLSIARSADLIVIVALTEEDLKFVQRELNKANIDFNGLIVFNSAKEVKNYYILDFSGDVSEIKEKIWSRLNLIYVYTKQPGKKKDFPPVALEKGTNVKGLALKVHKDFLKKFKFARVFGKSTKFDGQRCGLNHILKEGDVVEFHIK